MIASPVVVMYFNLRYNRSLKITMSSPGGGLLHHSKSRAKPKKSPFAGVLERLGNSLRSLYLLKYRQRKVTCKCQKQVERLF